MKIMTDFLHSSAETIIAEIFEKLAFITVTAAPPETSFADSDQYCRSQITLGEPFSGKVILLMPTHLVMVVAGVTCIESEEGGARQEEVVKDTICELLNTFAGGFMKKLVPDDQPINIGFPEFGEGIPDDSSGEKVLFLAEGQLFGLFVQGNES